MKAYRIDLGIIILLFDKISLLRSNNNKWSMEFLSYFYDKRYIKDEFDINILTSKGKQGAIKCLFEWSDK